MKTANYCTLILLAFLALVADAQGTRKVFLVEKTYQQGTARAYGNTASGESVDISFSPKIMKAFGEKCQAVTFTQNKDAAEFVLNPQPGGSILSSAKGDVLYISPAKTLHNMVKDVCGYVTAHPQ
jgi:hypothetical protein